MELPESITSDLPRPHDEDPEYLRDDIVAELSDHLQCAWRRERRRTADASEAWQAVLVRFGDPRQVARQLWFENMKELIMRQRITLALLVLAVAACFGALGLAWVSFSQLRESNDALLAQLTALTAPAAEPTGRVGNWTALHVQLVQENTDNVPAEGFNVTFSGKAVNPTDPITLKETTGADGSVKFGPILPGQYQLAIESPWNTYRRDTLVLLPADKHVKTYACPTTGPGEARVRFQVNWPHELKAQGLLDDVSATLELAPRYQTTVDGATWHCPGRPTCRFNVDGHVLEEGTSGSVQDGYAILRAIPHNPVRFFLRGEGYSFKFDHDSDTLFEAAENGDNIWKTKLPYDVVMNMRDRLSARSDLEASANKLTCQREILENLRAALQHIEGVQTVIQLRHLSLKYNGDPSPEAPIFLPDRCRINVIVPEAYVRRVGREALSSEGELDERQNAEIGQRVSAEVTQLVTATMQDVVTSCTVDVHYLPETDPELLAQVDQALEHIPGVKVEWLPQGNAMYPRISVPEAYILKTWRVGQAGDEQADLPEDAAPTENQFRRTAADLRHSIISLISDILPVAGNIDNRAKLVEVIFRH